MNYQRSLNKSLDSKEIKIRTEDYVKEAKKFKEFRLKATAFTVSVALTVTSFVLIKNTIKKTNLNFDIANQLLDRGYEAHPFGGVWDNRYQLINDIDPFSLFVYMGDSQTLKVLQYRGYESWEDYVKEQGYQNMNEWYKDKKKEIMNPKSKEKGGR